MFLEYKTETSETTKIRIENGCINRLPDQLVCEKTLILTDTGIPRRYVETVCSQFGDHALKTVAAGESSKCEKTLFEILAFMAEHQFDRSSKLLALGGGVVCDLGGLCASLYMRGIDFYAAPTTLLAQIDASVGGKNAIDFNGVKNIIGTFRQPKEVFIDPTVLETLDKRNYSNGMAEAVKTAAVCDSELFDRIYNAAYGGDIEYIVERCVEIKSRIVKEDTFDKGLRHILNFGHTVAHAIEMSSKTPILHGEAVAVGMLPMCSEDVRRALSEIYVRYSLPLSVRVDKEKFRDALKNDKKGSSSGIETVYAEAIGKYSFRKMTVDEIISEAAKVVIK